MPEPAAAILIRLNGQEHSVPSGATVADLVRRQNLPVDQVAIEVNRRLVRSSAYDRLLEAGDEVEIVTFVGGG
jgi:sulfur carrier protein